MKKITAQALLNCMAATGMLLLAGCSDPQNIEPVRHAKPVHDADYQRPPANPLKNAYFGETHVHTTYSMDANLFGTRNDPRMAYRFAMGEEILLPESKQRQREALKKLAQGHKLSGDQEQDFTHSL